MVVNHSLGLWLSVAWLTSPCISSRPVDVLAGLSGNLRMSVYHVFSLSSYDLISVRVILFCRSIQWFVWHWQSPVLVSVLNRTLPVFLHKIYKLIFHYRIIFRKTICSMFFFYYILFINETAFSVILVYLCKMKKIII